MRVSDYFDATAQRQPERVAIIEGDVEMNFGDAQRFVHAVAHALDREPGLRRGAHVAIYAPNHLRIPLLHLGINRSDRAWLSVHTRNPVEVNLQVLGSMDCEFVFFHSAYAAVVPQLRAGLPKVVKFVCIDRASEHGPSIDEWIADCWQPYAAGEEDPLSPAFVQPTGGTTGPSKAAVHAHRGLETSFMAGLDGMDITDQTRYLAVAPLTHAGGITAQHTLLAGGCVVVVNMTHPEQVFDAIERWKITHVFLPPTVMYMLLALPRAKTADCSSLRRFFTGAAPTAPEKTKEATRLFGPVMAEGYGLTECGMPLIVKKPSDYVLPDGGFDEEALRSAGRAVRVARVEIMGPDGRILPAGERGEIVVQSGTAMLGYYKNPDETAAHKLHGWRHTGDVGVKDARGFITIVDRLKDMIVSGGFNVFPAQVEAVILGHDAVMECAVVGVPDEKWGEAVKAVVQLKPGRTASEDELISLCRDRLGGVYAPKSVEFWPELPRSAVGKLLRREVRAKYWQGQWRSV